jgi:Family of unknown function (DUF6328)
MSDAATDRRYDEESRESEATHALDEARMVLPGIQALFGFQLIAVFNQRFTELPRSDQVIHLVSLLLVALAVAIIMAPAAYHRQAERGLISAHFIRLASRLVTLAMVPLMLGICLDLYVVSNLILLSRRASVAIVGSLFCVFLGLWFIFPQAGKKRSPSGR